MKARLVSIAWGFGGALLALALWLGVATVYTDHVLLQQVIAALNQAARQTQQAAPTAAPMK